MIFVTTTFWFLHFELRIFFIKVHGLRGRCSLARVRAAGPEKQFERGGCSGGLCGERAEDRAGVPAADAGGQLVGQGEAGQGQEGTRFDEENQAGKFNFRYQKIVLFLIFHRFLIIFTIQKSADLLRCPRVLNLTPLYIHSPRCFCVGYNDSKAVLRRKAEKVLKGRIEGKYL